jgi:hypothetical protein
MASEKGLVKFLEHEWKGAPRAELPSGEDVVIRWELRKDGEGAYSVSSTGISIGKPLSALRREPMRFWTGWMLSWPDPASRAGSIGTKSSPPISSVLDLAQGGTVVKILPCHRSERFLNNDQNKIV